MNDLDLLREYVQTGSQEAFAQVVRTHVDMVYSAARRQVRDAHLAEDVTQRVFVLLAQKAPTLRREVLLGGWLYNAARLAAADAQRAEIRRANGELREIFAHKGVILSAAGLSQALATKAVLTAPSGLAASAASAATALGAAGTTGILGGGVAIMAATKIKIAAAIVIATLA